MCRGREKKGGDQEGSHFLNVTSSTRLKLPKLDRESHQNLSCLKLWGK